MSVLDHNNLFMQNGSFSDCLKQWMLIIMMLVWGTLSVIGLHKWRQVSKSDANYNQVIIFLAIIKFFLMYVGIIFEANLQELYIIFWF